MDADRFDTLAKRLVTPTTRRATLATAATGGLLSALGLVHAAPETRTAQGGTCMVAFTAQVRQGPSREQPLTANASRAGEVRGDLSFSLSASGNLDNAALTLPDGTQLPVVGQATGHSLQVRIELGQRLALVAVGVGEQEIARCQGAIDGVATGPRSGDLGDWHAAGVQQARGGGQSGSGEAPGSGTPGTTVDPAQAETPPAGQGDASASSSSSSSGGSQSDPVACPPGETYCGYVEECRDLTTSPLDCGACATRCPSLVCQDGRCLSEEEADQVCASALNCVEGLLYCDGACIDPSTNPAHCGQCGFTCAPPLTCSGGGCACPSGTVNCVASNAALCVDPLTDPTNCGLCGIVCAEGTACQGGECITSGGGGCLAGSGLTYCGGVCVDLQTDSTNCGACGVSCGGGVCAGGVCTYCLITMLNCGGVCVIPSSDSSNCGGCGIVCPEGTSCQNSVCVATGGA